MHSYRTHTCNELRESDVGEAARISGWVHRKRDHGQLLFIDLREESERVRDGIIPGSVHTPYQHLRQNIEPGGMLAAIAANPDQELLLYCAYGERSALAYSEMHEAGLVNTCHLAGGIDAWIKAGGPVEHPTERTAQG